MSADRVLKKLIGPALGLLLFSGALGVLYRELHAYRFNMILHAWNGLPYWKFVWALIFTAVNYSFLTGYDYLALRFIRKPLPYHKIAFASFVGYAFSNNIGPSMIAGATVRYRLYSVFGLSPSEITRVVVFCTMSVWIGFLTLAGFTFTFMPMALPRFLHLPFGSVRMVGILQLILVAALFWVSMLGKKTIKIKTWTFSIPDPRYLMSQIALSVVDRSCQSGARVPGDF